MSQEEPKLVRRAVLTGLAAGGSLMLGGCASKELPPTYGNLLRMGDLLTYRVFRLALPAKALAREYERSDITSSTATGTTNPAEAEHCEAYDPEGGARYAQLAANGFADWRLNVEGSVARPRGFSLADLAAMRSRTQVTKHSCEEGWSAINEWTGVPLRAVLEAAGILPSARFIAFYAFDAYAESIDMIDALHPQTILAYGMNGRTLPVAHGAPARLRVETQMGYKSIKFIDRIVVSDSFDTLGKLGDVQNGWAWYVGI